MRILLTILLAALGTQAGAQSLEGSLSSGLGGGLGSGLGGGLSSGLTGTLGTQQMGRSRALTEENGFSAPGACAPGQLDLNHAGCRPAREFFGQPTSTYDQSIQAMRPLSGLTLDGLTMGAGAGPAGPLD